MERDSQGRACSANEAVAKAARHQGAFAELYMAIAKAFMMLAEHQARLDAGQLDPKGAQKPPR